MSLYADDVVVFLRLVAEEWGITNAILQIFAQASGLITNLNKTELYPIQCQETDLTFLSASNTTVSSFPCQYLWLPLHFRKLPRDLLHPLIQKIGDRLLGWKKNFLSYPSRELLVKTVLYALPTFFLTVFKMPK
jgi:hypothetical protein